MNSAQSMHAQLQQMVLDKMEYQKKILKKDIDITIMAQRIVAAQRNLSGLSLKNQETSLDVYHGSTAERLEVEKLITSVHEEMKPSKGDKVPDTQPDPGYFLTTEDIVPEELSEENSYCDQHKVPQTKETSTASDEHLDHKHSEATNPPDGEIEIGLPVSPSWTVK